MKKIKSIITSAVALMLASAAFANPAAHLVPFHEAATPGGTKIYIYYSLGSDNLVCKSGSKNASFKYESVGGSGIYTGPNLMLSRGAAVESGKVVYYANDAGASTLSCEYKD